MSKLTKKEIKELRKRQEEEKKYTRAEFFLVVIIGILIISSLLSQQYFNLPFQYTSVLIFIFLIVKTIQIIRKGGTIFEDYIALGMLLIVWVLHFILGESLKPVVSVAIVILLLYSAGLIPWLKVIIRSKSISTFILSYAFLILVIIFLFSGIYFSNNTDFKEEGIPASLTFEESIYFSTITFTTVGYGDISPIGINRLISSIQAVTALIMNIAFIGYILSSKRFKKIEKQ